MEFFLSITTIRNRLSVYQWPFLLMAWVAAFSNSCPHPSNSGNSLEKCAPSHSWKKFNEIIFYLIFWQPIGFLYCTSKNLFCHFTFPTTCSRNICDAELTIVLTAARLITRASYFDVNIIFSTLKVLPHLVHISWQIDSYQSNFVSPKNFNPTWQVVL